MPAHLPILYTAPALGQPSGWVTSCQNPAAAEKTHAFPSIKPCAIEQLEAFASPSCWTQHCSARKGLVRCLPGRVNWDHQGVVKVSTCQESNPCFKDFIQQPFHVKCRSNSGREIATQHLCSITVESCSLFPDETCPKNVLCSGRTVLTISPIHR